MRRAGPTSLLIGFTLLGSGALEYLHNRDHAHRDAAAAAPECHGHEPAASHEGPCHRDGGPPAHRGHDETNCHIHAQLHMPLLAGGWVAVLVCVGLFVCFLHLPSPRPTPQRVPLRTDCRGPPAC